MATMVEDLKQNINKKAELPFTKAARLSYKTRGFPSLLYSKFGFFFGVISNTS